MSKPIDALSGQGDSLVATPCKNICVLGADELCLGCYRTLEEVACWGGASESERARIVAAARLRAGARLDD